MMHEDTDKIRLFTAIGLPQSFIEELENMKSNSNMNGRVNWTNPENLHITTCFIGETEKNELATIQGKISDIAKSTDPFQLEFRNIQLAPPKKKPYMIWANYNKSDLFTDLCNKLFLDLLNNQKNNHFPHVTLARFKGFVRIDARQKRHVFPSIEVDKIGLWKSILKPSGPTYEKLDEFLLGF